MNFNAPAKHLESLQLGGDGDEADLILAVEQAFAVRFTDAELEAFETVGQIFDAVRAKSPEQEHGALAAMLAFYRLRTALLGQAPRNSIVPEAKLADVVQMPAYQFHAELERRTGLNVPGLHFSRIGNLGLMLILAGAILMIAPIFIALPRWLGFVSFVAGVGLMYADPRQLPDMTLGEFARELAMLNYAAFAQSGSRTDEAGLWNALVRVIELETGIKGVITPATRLF